MAGTKTGRPPSCRCGECRKCKHAAYMRRWYQQKSPEERRAWTARRNPDLVREQDRKKMARRRRDGTPEQLQRIEARAVLGRAVRSGLVAKPDVCSRDADGGCDGRIEAHHEDHSRPLDVVWLCRAHHREADARLLEKVLP